MADSKLGTKQLCPECGAKFYDLNKRPAVCPKCSHSFEPDEEESFTLREKVKAKATAAAATASADEDAEESETEAVNDEEEGEEETVAELGTEDLSLIHI